MHEGLGTRLTRARTTAPDLQMFKKAVKSFGTAKDKRQDSFSFQCPIWLHHAHAHAIMRILQSDLSSKLEE